MELKPHEIERLLHKARLMSESGGQEKAQKLITELVALKPTPELQAALGDECRKAGNYEGAISAYQAALKLDRKHYRCLVGLGTAFAAVGDLKRASDVYSYTVATYPDAAEVRVNLGNIMARLKKYNEAEICYLRALHDAPDFPEADRAYYNLGRVYMLTRREELAYEALLWAAERNPDRAVDAFFDETYEPLRSQERFEEIVRRGERQLFAQLDTLRRRQQGDDLRRRLESSPFVRNLVWTRKPLTSFRMFAPRRHGQ